VVVHYLVAVPEVGIRIQVTLLDGDGVYVARRVSEAGNEGVVPVPLLQALPVRTSAPDEAGGAIQPAPVRDGFPQASPEPKKTLMALGTWKASTS